MIMKIDCLTVESGYVRVKKYKLTLTPYAQSLLKCSQNIFTDDLNGYLESLKQSFDIDVSVEIKVECRWNNKEQEQFLNVLNKSFDYSDAINHLSEYSAFAYYGYISPSVQSSVLTSLKDEYRYASEKILNQELIKVVKGIRKEYFEVTIPFKGKEVKPDDKLISSLAMLMFTPQGETIPYRFEDGSFANLTVDDITKLYKTASTYIQKVMSAEKTLLENYAQLDQDIKENLIIENVGEIKKSFDKFVRDGK